MLKLEIKRRNKLKPKKKSDKEEGKKMLKEGL
jgi:hypothetical protein